MNKNELIAQLNYLGLPSHEYMVVGGGVLAAHNIRDTDDIDLVVTPKLFDQLKRNWTVKIRPNGKLGLYRDCVEAYLDVSCGNFGKSFQWLFNHSKVIDGIHFIDLDTLADFKMSYGRKKDLLDLQLIKAYQNRK